MASVPGLVNHLMAGWLHWTSVITEEKHTLDLDLSAYNVSVSTTIHGLRGCSVYSPGTPWKFWLRNSIKRIRIEDMASCPEGKSALIEWWNDLLITHVYCLLSGWGVAPQAILNSLSQQPVYNAISPRARIFIIQNYNKQWSLHYNC